MSDEAFLRGSIPFHLGLGTAANYRKGSADIRLPHHSPPNPRMGPFSDWSLYRAPTKKMGRAHFQSSYSVWYSVHVDKSCHPNIFVFVRNILCSKSYSVCNTFMYKLCIWSSLQNFTMVFTLWKLESGLAGNNISGFGEVVWKNAWFSCLKSWSL